MNILLELGVDSSFIKQFVIVVIMFFLTKRLFLSQLQAIIEKREEKTIKSLEGNDLKEVELHKLKTKYHDTLAKNLKEIRQKTDEEKNVILKEFENEYSEHEQKINEDITEARKKSETEMKEKKDQVLSGVDSLSQDLLGKLAGGKQ